MKESIAAPPPPFPPNFFFVALAGVGLLQFFVFPQVIFDEVGDEPFSRFWAEGLNNETGVGECFPHHRHRVRAGIIVAAVVSLC